jgi:hypothetical protein
MHPPDAFALPALAVIFFYIFRRNTQLLIIPGLTFVGSVAVGQLIYANSIRHWGITFVAFVATLWIYRVWNPQRSYFAMGLLAITIAPTYDARAMSDQARHCSTDGRGRILQGGSFRSKLSGGGHGRNFGVYPPFAISNLIESKEPSSEI